MDAVRLVIGGAFAIFGAYAVLGLLVMPGMVLRERRLHPPGPPQRRVRVAMWATFAVGLVAIAASVCTFAGWPL